MSLTNTCAISSQYSKTFYIKCYLDYSSLNPKLNTDGCVVIIGTSYNVQTILEKMKGANIDVEDAKERTPLHGAVMYNNTDVVELLVDR